MDPSRFSLRSVTEAMPTPRSKTRRESLILSLHMVRLVLAQWTVVNSMRIILAQKLNRYAIIIWSKSYVNISESSYFLGIRSYEVFPRLISGVLVVVFT